jgi:hypothetical protein
VYLTGGRTLAVEPALQIALRMVFGLSAPGGTLRIGSTTVVS